MTIHRPFDYPDPARDSEPRERDQSLIDLRDRLADKASLPPEQIPWSYVERVAANG